MDEWRQVDGFPGYEVSITGRVRSFLPGRPVRLLKPTRGHRLKYRVVFARNVHGEKVCLYVHRLVLLAFRGDPPAGHVTRHLDGDAENNRLDNLLWGTMQENSDDMKRHGRARSGGLRGNDHPMAKLTDAEVVEIRRAYPARSLKQLARAYGVCKSTIGWIVKRGTWRHLTEG